MEDVVGDVPLIADEHLVHHRDGAFVGVSRKHAGRPGEDARFRRFRENGRKDRQKHGAQQQPVDRVAHLVGELHDQVDGLVRMGRGVPPPFERRVPDVAAQLRVVLPRRFEAIDSILWEIVPLFAQRDHRQIVRPVSRLQDADILVVRHRVARIHGAPQEQIHGEKLRTDDRPDALCAEKLLVRAGEVVAPEAHLSAVQILHRLDAALLLRDDQEVAPVHDLPDVHETKLLRAKAKRPGQEHRRKERPAGPKLLDDVDVRPAPPDLHVDPAFQEEALLPGHVIPRELRLGVPVQRHRRRLLRLRGFVLHGEGSPRDEQENQRRRDEGDRRTKPPPY